VRAHAVFALRVAVFAVNAAIAYAVPDAVSLAVNTVVPHVLLTAGRAAVKMKF